MVKTHLKTSELYRKYLDPKVVSTMGGLELKARLVVEGFLSGMHKSPSHGFNVEFTQHRQYEPGDELRTIDWRVWARTDRYYIKQFEEETNLKATLVLDCSASMKYHSRRNISKFHYGQVLAAAVAYLLLHQQDAVGLALFDETLTQYLPPRSTPTHIKTLLSLLDTASPGGTTHLSDIFHTISERINRRGVLILISDFYDTPDSIISALQHARYRKHEVIIFHILDPDELDFPFHGQVQFHDMETGEEIMTNAGAIRAQYCEEIQAFINMMKRTCGQSNIDYITLRSDTPYDTALRNFLIRRKRT